MKPEELTKRVNTMYEPPAIKKAIPIFRMKAKPMSISSAEIEKAQQAFCRQKSATHLPPSAESKLGFALSTKGLTPINGLRHPPQGDTNGWYLWCGEQSSDAADFFQPSHTQHIYEQHPEVARLLCLPAGYRFLLAGDHLDVWYDSSLLKV